LFNFNIKFLFFFIFIFFISFTFSPSQESQKIFKAKYPIEPETIKAKLIGFGMQLLENIDPNSENYVTAGIVHTTQQKVGCLIRLEPNTQAQVSSFNYFYYYGSSQETR